MGKKQKQITNLFKLSSIQLTTLYNLISQTDNVYSL